MNIAYLYGNDRYFIYPRRIFSLKVLSNQEIFSCEKGYFTCKLQALFINYGSFLNLQGSIYTPYKNQLNIYNINGYLKTLKNANRTDIFICKELLSLQKIKRSFVLHPKPK